MRRFSAITTAQLARICGVSQGTVDRALHGRGEINAQTKERILSVAKEYGYTPRVKNSVAGKSMLIGVVLFDLYNAFFSKLAMSFAEKAQEIGYSVVFQFSNKSIENERAAIEYFNFIGVDGIVLFPVGSDSEEYSEYLHSIHRPIVTVGNRLSVMDFIGIDDEAAMYDLTKKMLEECQGKIGYFAPVLRKELHSQNAQLLRFSGYRKAMDEAGGHSLLITDEDKLSDTLSGIISSTDHYLLRVLQKLGDSPVKLAGFDNTDIIKRIGKNTLSVEYSTDKIAEECIKYILGRPFSSEISHSIVINSL